MSTTKISWGRQNAVPFSTLIERVANNELPQLDVLRGRAIGDAEALQLAEAVTTSSSLATLQVHAGNLGPSGLAAIFKAVCVSSSVRQFSVSGTKLDKETCEAIAAAIKEASESTMLYLSLLDSLMLFGCDIAPDALLPLAMALNPPASSDGSSSCRRVANHIGFGNCHAPSEVWTTFAEACSATGVTSLDIRSSSFGDASVTALAPLAAPHSKLTMLSLIFCKLGPTESDAPVRQDDSSSSSSSSSSSGAGGEEASGSQQQGGEPRSAYVGRRAAVAEGGAETLEALAALPTLEYLALRQSPLLDEEARSIARGLTRKARLPSLWGKAVTLNLMSCSLTDMALCAMADEMSETGLAADAASAAAASDGKAAEEKDEEEEEERPCLTEELARSYGLGVHLHLNDGYAAKRSGLSLAALWQSQVRAALASVADDAAAEAAAASAAAAAEEEEEEKEEEMKPARLLIRSINLSGSQLLGMDATCALVQSAGQALGQVQLLGATKFDTFDFQKALKSSIAEAKAAADAESAGDATASATAASDSDASAPAAAPAEAEAAQAAAATAAAEEAAEASSSSSSAHTTPSTPEKDEKPAFTPEVLNKLCTVTAWTMSRFQAVLPAGAAFGPELRLQAGPTGGTGPGVDLSGCLFTDDEAATLLTAINAACEPRTLNVADMRKQQVKYRRTIPGDASEPVKVVVENNADKRARDIQRGRLPASRGPASANRVGAARAAAAAAAAAVAGGKAVASQAAGSSSTLTDEENAAIEVAPARSLPASLPAASQMAADDAAAARQIMQPLQGLVTGPFIWLGLQAIPCRKRTYDAAAPLCSWLRMAMKR